LKFKNFIALFIACHLSAGMILTPDSLPANAKDFLQKNFSSQVTMVQLDKNTYEVYLSDGTEMEFYLDGSWKEIEAKFNFLSFDILPPNLASILKNQFPNTAIKELKRKIGYYKIELNNGLEIIMDFNGTILHTEFDD